MCDVMSMFQCTGDYGVPDCVLQSDGQYMTIEMHTDSFMQGPGFRATHIAIDDAKDPGLDSKCEYPFFISSVCRPTAHALGLHASFYTKIL